MSNGSRLADQIFYNDAANSDWGLLNDRFSAFPAYYAMWMWNTYLPPGSVRVGVQVDWRAARPANQRRQHADFAQRLVGKHQR